MNQERLQFGRNLMDELEAKLKDLDPNITTLDLEQTIEYMGHIRGKMLAQYYFQNFDEEIKAQIIKMTKCIDAVRELIKTKDASSM
jgi:septation ring formation regulator EzrA